MDSTTSHLQSGETNAHRLLPDLAAARKSIHTQMDELQAYAHYMSRVSTGFPGAGLHAWLQGCNERTKNVERAVQKFNELRKTLPSDYQSLSRPLPSSTPESILPELDSIYQQLKQEANIQTLFGGVRQEQLKQSIRAYSGVLEGALKTHDFLYDRQSSANSHLKELEQLHTLFSWIADNSRPQSLASGKQNNSTLTAAQICKRIFDKEYKIYETIPATSVEATRGAYLKSAVDEAYSTLARYGTE